MTAVEFLAQQLDLRWGTTEAWAQHILDEMEAAGYAVVELPKPDSHWLPHEPRWQRDSEPDRPEDARGGVATVAVMRKEVKAFISCLSSPDDARWAAAALLAAARAAEAGDE